jgi:hypothetical protein
LIDVSDNYSNVSHSRGIFIRYASETGRGVSVDRVTPDGTNTIFRVNTGYIVTDSYFNSVNYNGDRISIHVRYADAENSQMQYLYDRIFILNEKGKVIGHFWFRDMATYISSQIGFFKHMKYFYFYFNSVQQVYVTQRRLVMIFPTASPLGLRVVNDGFMQWHIHPEYIPENKIKSMVVSYNFVKDQECGYYDSNYEMTDLLYQGRDLFDSEIDDIPGWNHQMKFDMLKPFASMEERNPYTGKYEPIRDKTVYLDKCFELVLSIPDSFMNLTGIAENHVNGLDNYVRPALPPTRTFKDIMVSQAAVENLARLHMMGCWFAPFIQPTMVYIGSDSSILGVNLRVRDLDINLDAMISNHDSVLSMLADYPDIQNAIRILQALAGSMTGSKSISFSKYSKHVFDVFTRIGPHCYIYITPQGLAFPVIEYQEQYYFLNNQKVASGNRPYIWGEVLSLYDKKFIRFGRSLYKGEGGEPEPVEPSNPYSWNLSCTTQELKLFRYFDENPYTQKHYNHDYIVGRIDDENIIMADWLNKRYLKTEGAIKPVMTVGDRRLVGVYTQGSLSEAVMFYSADTDMPVQEKEDSEGYNITEKELDMGNMFFFAGMKREIIELQPGYKGFFAKVTDGNAEEWFFVTSTGNKMYRVKGVVNHTYSNWKRIIAEEAEAHEGDSYCDLRKFLQEEMKGEKTESITDTIDSIKVIGGEYI